MSFYHGFLTKRALFKVLSGTRAEAKELAQLPASTRQWLDEAGFVALGAYQEAVGGFPAPKLNRLAYADPQRLIRVSLGVNRSRNFKNKGELLYTFLTFFKDGSAVITWCVPNPRTQSNPRLESRGSQGSIAQDYAAHRARVEARIAQGDAPLRIESIKDVEATYFDFYRRVITDDDAKRATALWVMTCGKFYLIPVYVLIALVVMYLKY